MINLSEVETAKPQHDALVHKAARHVLVVDDDPIQLSLMRAHLKSAGFEVYTAERAMEALEAARTRRPDVILSDVLIEDLDGYALCTILRCDPALGTVPVVLLTTHVAGEADRKLALSSGAQSLVERSPGFENELEAVTRALESDAPARRWSPEPSMRRMAAQMTQLLERSHTAERRYRSLFDNANASEQKYRMLIENIPDVVWSSTLDGEAIFFSPHVVRVCGYTAQELMAVPASFWFERVHPEDLPALRKAWGDVSKKGYEAEYRFQRKDGQWIWLRSRASVRVDAAGNVFAEGTFADVSEQKRLEAQVRQSQKMEAIGQLTGGVAHDFNNILAIILGNSEFLRDTLPVSDPRRADAEAIIEAGQRGASLTKQLLAFSRRQVLQPRVLDLNTIVQGVETMLRRVIGEDIDLSIKLGQDVYAVRADAGQLEQVIMNLAVNARDAMPLGGKLSIETSNVTLENAYAQHLGVSVSGDFAMLAVSDTGCGMDEKTRRRVFEPFFTTKEQGKGTGLGLSMCYGMVKQSDGYIFVYSEPGQGSVFKVYLPRVTELPEAAAAFDQARPDTPRGQETILLIEDDSNVRDTIRRILTGRGYRVLEAGESEEADTIAHTHGGQIHLIVSDMVIPGSAGPELVKRLQSALGPVKTLFMSGYTDHALLRNRMLHADVNFIQKPFMPATLAAKVREVLDA